MLSTFESLAEFDSLEKGETIEQEANDNATVDMTSIINRLNDMETKINQLLNASTSFPTRGNENKDNTITNESEENNNESNTDS